MSREGLAECSRRAGQLIKPGVRLALAVGFLLLPQCDCAPALIGVGPSLASGQTAPAVGPQEACTGDCGNDGQVTIDELLTLVNIALGHPRSCTNGIPAGATVDIALLLTAVNDAQNGCGGDGCLVASGGAAATCVSQYAAAIGACRNQADAACEAALEGAGGRLAALVADTEEPVRGNCTADAANKLTFLLGVDELVSRTAQACRKWGEDLVAVTYATDLAGSAPEVLACQQVVGAQLAALHDEVVQAYGSGCYVAEFNGQPCDRSGRDRRVAQARTTAAAVIEPACGPAFDSLGLVPLTASATLTGRIDALMDVVVGHARQLAQRVYPPLNLGPTGLFGPSPVGVRAVDLADPSRLDVAGVGPRPVRAELYYPSTPEAVAGVPRDVAQIFGNDIFVTPTYRDVARAPGALPLVLLSGGNGSDPWNYVYLAAHLASHGFLVAGVEHHGDHLFDTSDASNALNRPLDLSFVLDQLLAFNEEPGNFLAGAIDAARIGAAGHSAGGYTVMALAMCPFALGVFTDPRVKAILPLDPSATVFLSDQSPAIFSAITVPTLLVGGTLSRFAPVAPLVFDALEPGPTVMGVANLIDAVHGTFDDTCEIPDAILDLTGGPAAECEPGALPWRYARHITNYLALNFFDATLNGKAEALARLDPAMLSTTIEDITYQSRTGGCPNGVSCSLTCTEAACGDGFVGPKEECDPPGEQGACAAGDLCNTNCTACVTCDVAAVIEADGGVVVGTTVGGTTVLGGRCGGAVFAPERLFQWTPSLSHVATIQTCGGTTDYDTTLSVREGTCVGPELACNDDGDSCGPQSKITMSVVAGTTYFIVVDGFATDAGNFTLSVF